MMTVNELIDQLKSVAEQIGGDCYVEAYGNGDFDAGASLYFKRVVARPSKDEWETGDWSRIIKNAGGDMAVHEGGDKVVLAEVLGHKITL